MAVPPPRECTLDEALNYGITILIQLLYPFLRDAVLIYCLRLPTGVSLLSAGKGGDKASAPQPHKKPIEVSPILDGRNLFVILHFICNFCLTRPPRMLKIFATTSLKGLQLPVEPPTVILFALDIVVACAARLQLCREWIFGQAIFEFLTL